MRKYTKSITVAKRERARRKRVLELADRGLNQTQVASELGVSVRTVRRDLAKLERYISYLIFKRRLSQRDLFTERLNTYPPEQRLSILTDLMIAKGSPSEGRVFLRFLAGKHKPLRR